MVGSERRVLLESRFAGYRNSIGSCVPSRHRPVRNSGGLGDGGRLQLGRTNGNGVSGASVRIEQVRHAYAFGTFVGNTPIQTGRDAAEFRRLGQVLFNRVTLPRYWADWGTDSIEVLARADAVPARFTRDFPTAVFFHEATTGLTTWGFGEGDMWRADLNTELSRNTKAVRAGPLSWRRTRLE